MARYGFDETLESLQLDLVAMASLVEKSIDDAIYALKHYDRELAKDIIKQDDEIDNMEREIENRCIKLIAMQQPLAKDLRMITSILKMITDLERIADHSTDISELVLQMDDDGGIKAFPDICKMAAVAREMVKGAIDAYINNDTQLAEEVCQRDYIVDDYFESILKDVQAWMKDEPKQIKSATHLILITKYIEKVADHATNLAEWVIYNVTGVHENLN